MLNIVGMFCCVMIKDDTGVPVTCVLMKYYVQMTASGGTGPMVLVFCNDSLGEDGIHLFDKSGPIHTEDPTTTRGQWPPKQWQVIGHSLDGTSRIFSAQTSTWGDAVVSWEKWMPFGQ
jgi:hypothetical protein